MYQMSIHSPSPQTTTTYNGKFMGWVLNSRPTLNLTNYRNLVQSAKIVRACHRHHTHLVSFLIRHSHISTRHPIHMCPEECQVSILEPELLQAQIKER